MPDFGTSSLSITRFYLSHTNHMIFFDHLLLREKAAGCRYLNPCSNPNISFNISFNFQLIHQYIETHTLFLSHTHVKLLTPDLNFIYSTILHSSTTKLFCTNTAKQKVVFLKLFNALYFLSISFFIIPIVLCCFLALIEHHMCIFTTKGTLHWFEWCSILAYFWRLTVIWRLNVNEAIPVLYSWDYYD